jgi:NAD(P)H-dependent flavin oxidoreductase YrpB (nitropropane dioxygenase family)
MASSGVLKTSLTELTGVRHPIVQTAMGWVSDVDLVVATASAGGLGFLASAMMTTEELETSIRQIIERTDQPFGVNLRADASDAEARADLLIKYGVKVAGFALAPKRELIAKLKDQGVIIVPSVGAVRHAEKVAAWGADMVMAQGGEGGGHTGGVATSLLLPAVIDAVDIPVIAAGGYFDGRGLASALAYGAAGVGMGTRFLLTSECNVPATVKEIYLQNGLDSTVITRRIDGLPLRVLRTGLAEELDKEGASSRKPGYRLKNVFDLKRESGTSWLRLMRDGLEMRSTGGRSLAQMMQAANTPMMMRLGLIEGDLSAGVLASGQVVGVISDIPTCRDLIERTVAQAIEAIHALESSKAEA